MKKIVLVFKNGAIMDVAYSSKVYTEIDENLGKDHKVSAKSFAINTKNIDGVFFKVGDTAVEE